MKLYIGIDPGTIKLGYAVLSETEIVESGTVRLNTRNSEIEDRIIAMTYAMRELFRKYKYAEELKVGIEDQYIGKNMRDTLRLSRLTGALMYVCFDTLGELPVFVHPTKLQLLGKSDIHLSTGELAKYIVSMLYKFTCETEDEAVAICIAELLRTNKLN